MIEVIKLGAEWCAPCKAMSPTIKSLKEKYDAIEGSNVNIIEIDVDENPELGEKYKVKNIPTLVFVKDGEMVQKKVGVLNESQIEEIIKELSKII
jgi:thioredoxin 1